MIIRSIGVLQAALALSFLAASSAGCKANGSDSRAAVAQPPFMSTVASTPPQSSDDAPPPEKTGGFDGKRAYALVAKQVGFGPRPSGSPAIAKLQDFLESELKT
jgi:hypothetical protein